MTLNGKRILVTRSAEQAAALNNALAKLGAAPVVVPLIEIVGPPSYAELDRAVAELDQTDYLILTSVNAVKSFFDRLATLDIGTQQMQAVKTVAVGPQSATAIRKYGVDVDLVPDDYRAEGVVAVLKEKVSGKRVLYPKAALARDLIPEALEQAGAEVISPVAYGSAPPCEAPGQLKQALQDGLDMVTFTASSAVDNFVSLLDKTDLAKALKVPVASIGPLTTATAQEYGFNVVAEPDNSTLDDMVEAINSYFVTRDAERRSQYKQ